MYQKKSCFYLELDSGIQGQRKESIAKEEKEDRILIVDETLIKISNQFVWIWIAVIDSTDKIILGVHISIERTMLIAE